MERFAQAAYKAAMPREYFEKLYDATDDPWRIAGNWYEQRKRGLIAAILPRRRFRHALEPACGSGDLTLELGRYCDHVLAGDFSPTAVGICRARWEQEKALQRTGCAATFVCMTIPDDWPQLAGACFDLIVISEFAYYLDAAGLQALATLANASLSADGVLLACHWRHDFAQRRQTTAAVHAAFDALPGLHHAAGYRDDDFLLDLWSRQTRSVAQHAGVA